MVDLSIIIVNWNTHDLLDRCLACVYAARDTLDLEVIVVDNASSDGSVALVRERYPEVRLIANERNVGFAAANNQGLRIAQGGYFLLLNSDAFVHRGALQKLVSHMQAFPDSAIAGCRLYYEGGKLQRSTYAFPTLTTELWLALRLDRLFPSSRLFGKYQMTYWDMDDVQEVDCVMGACMIIRRSATEQVGLLDERFFMYSEEVDLCYRVKKAGWKVRFVPHASAIHLWGGSARRLPAESVLRLYGSRVAFFRKHYGSVQATAYKGILYMSSMLRVIGGRLAGVIQRDPDTRQSTQNYQLLFRSLHRL